MPRKKDEKLIPPKTKEVSLIPEDLKAQWGAIKACSTALALFDQGMFRAQHAQFVAPTGAFLAKLHEQSVEQALRHPQAHMIPELKEYMTKGAKNGEATQEASS